MAKKSETFSRGGAKFKQQPSVLVVCEDSKSSRDYINGLRKRFAIPNVKVDHFGDTSPKKIISEAIKRGKNHDHIYCVLDSDVFAAENFDPVTSIPSAQRERVMVIVSSPCFEYWLLLHFKNTRKSFTSGSVLKALLKEHGMGEYKKGGVNEHFDLLFGNLDVAVLNAASVRRQNHLDGSHSPMTDMDVLVERLKVLVMPQLIDQ